MKKWMALLGCLMLCLTGCTPVQEQPSPAATALEAPVTIHAITLGTMPSGGLDSLYAQLDALTVPELGCRLRFTYIPWGDERNQLNIAISSGEYDILPQGNFSDYQLMASRNAFLDIKPYLSLVPELAEHYRLTGEDVLANVEIDGRLYGIPQYVAPGTAANEGFFYREDLREQWGLEPVTSLETMEAYLYRAKEDAAFRDHPLITDNRIWTSLWEALAKDRYFEIVSFTETPYTVVGIDDPYRVISRIETPEFRKVIEYLTRWHQDGILDKRLLTLSANEGTSGRVMMLDGEKPCETNSPIWTLHRDWVPALQEAHPEWRFGFYAYAAHGRVMAYKSSAGGSSLLVISSRTRYPEICIRLLEKLHTDQRYYDLLLYGVEGEHYYREGDAVHSNGIPSDKRYVGWTAANDSYMDRDEADIQPSQWHTEVYQPLLQYFGNCTDSAVFHPLNHLTLSADAVGQETAALADAWNAYMMPLLCGLSGDVDADLDEAIRQMKNAGLDQHITNIQKALDSFAGTR